MRRWRAFLVAAVFAATILLAAAASSPATHVRPRGATPLRVPLVLAFGRCAAPNRTHGAPLAFQSCNPPTQDSIYLTVGTPDANGAGANSVGSILINALPGDARTRVNVTDVRCLPSVAATVCNSANSVDGPDYSGNMEIAPSLRVTDHLNGPSLTEAATMVEIPLEVDVLCANTVSTAVGSECSTDTTFNAVIPNALQAGSRTIWQLGQLNLTDGGADGDIHRGDPAGGIFLRQGVFVP
jgi:hypothetical protein